MSDHATSVHRHAWVKGMRDAIPLLGGYIPVATSFGLIANQAGFSSWEAIIISLVIYAGASQFLFVGMVASGAPLWLVVLMTLLINARHLVYAPNLAPWLTGSRRWLWLMHGLTDQIFALAHTRLPAMPPSQRLGWFTGAMLLAWFSWVGGTALGAIAGQELTERWPLLNDIMPFALPALFLVLLAPRFTSSLWAAALGCSILVALLFAANGLPNVAIPVSALLGAAVFFVVQANTRAEVQYNGK